MGSPSGRECLLRLRDRVRAAQERTAQAQEKRAKKQAKRQQEKAAKPEVPTFALEPEGPKKKRPLNSTDVMEWFRAALLRLYGAQAAVPEGNKWWTQRERKHALVLLQKWGPDRLRKAIDYFVDSWPQRVALNQGLTTGMPGLRLFVAMGDQIFGEASGAILMEKHPALRAGKRGSQTARREAARTKGEWKGEVPKRGVGWDDE